MSKQLDYFETIKLELQKEEIERFGVAPLIRPLTMDFYLNWLKSNYHGSMKYLERHADRKEEPQKLLPRANSAIVVAFEYIPHPFPQRKINLNIARYAQGKDYHFWLQEKLDRISKSLGQIFPNDVFCSYSDSYPVLERELAYRAALGWVGKNSCIIDQKKGSFFLIGEIYTSLKLESSVDPRADRCGTCTRCIDICPTQAIISPRLLDAKRCISYLTIESKEIPQVELRSKIGDHFFGCDLCQTVCPWNQKAFGLVLNTKDVSKTELIEDLRFILKSSNRELERFFEDTPLSRTPAWGHKRNALIIIANKNIYELTEEVKNLKSYERLKELAEWTLNQFQVISDSSK